MSRLSYDLPQILVLDCGGLLGWERLRALEAQGARIVRVQDPCDALEHLVLRRIDGLLVALAAGERSGVLLVEEMDRDPLLRRMPVVVELEDFEPRLVQRLLECSVDRVLPLGGADEATADALLWGGRGVQSAAG